MYKIIIIVLLIIIDIVSKKLIYEFINLFSLISIFSFFDLSHIHNTGISFGLFKDIVLPWVFILISSIITLLIIIMYFQTKNILEKWGFIFIIAGALSNIIDRIINGFVIDFILLHYKDFYWPAFNFADIYISIGVGIIVLQLLNGLRKKVIK